MWAGRQNCGQKRASDGSLARQKRPILGLKNMEWFPKKIVSPAHILNLIFAKNWVQIDQLQPWEGCLFKVPPHIGGSHSVLTPRYQRETECSNTLVSEHTHISRRPCFCVKFLFESWDNYHVCTCTFRAFQTLNEYCLSGQMNWVQIFDSRTHWKKQNPISRSERR